MAEVNEIPEINATTAEKAEAFEWLRKCAIAGDRLALVSFVELAKLNDELAALRAQGQSEAGTQFTLGGTDLSGGSKWCRIRKTICNGHTGTANCGNCDSAPAAVWNGERWRETLYTPPAAAPAGPGEAADERRKDTSLYTTECSECPSGDCSDCPRKYGAEPKPDRRKAQPDAPVAEPVGQNNYVQPVPDHCDRITWRNRYYALPLAPHRPEAAGWIDVNKRLPAIGTQCLVWNSLDFIEIDTWNEHHEEPVPLSSATICTVGWEEHEFDEVTHWQPAPAKPLLSRLEPK